MPEKVTIAYRGAKYEIGRGKRYYGIWVAGAPASDPIDRWPETPHGWNQAWARFTAVETPGTISQVEKPRTGLKLPAVRKPADGAGGAPGRQDPGAPVATANRRAKPERAAVAAGLVGLGVLLGLIGLFPGYLGSPSLVSQTSQLVPHLVYLVTWAVSGALIAVGARRLAVPRFEVLRRGALLGAGLSAVTFGLFLADVGQVISGGSSLLGAGLVLSLLGWLGCAAGSLLALTARPPMTAPPASAGLSSYASAPAAPPAGPSSDGPSSAAPSAPSSAAQSPAGSPAGGLPADPSLAAPSPAGPTFRAPSPTGPTFRAPSPAGPTFRAPSSAEPTSAPPSSAGLPLVAYQPAGGRPGRATAGGPAKPRLADAGPLALVLLAAIGVVAAFAPSWDSYTFTQLSTGATQTVTQGNAFAVPGAIIAGNVAVMVAVIVIAVLAALWRPARHGALLLAGATVPLAAQAISALIQIREPMTASQFGISPSAGVTITSGVTPIFWVYCVFVISLVVSCAWMLTAPRYPAMPAVPQSPAPRSQHPAQDVDGEDGDSDDDAEDDAESTYA